MPASPIPNRLAINSYLHCGLCLNSRQTDQSPREWAQLEVGFTSIGLQVWCKRHAVNVAHIDFQGYQHPANTTRERGDGPDDPR